MICLHTNKIMKVEYNSILGRMITLDEDVVILPDVTVKITTIPMIKVCKICGSNNAEMTSFGMMCYPCMIDAWRETELKEPYLRI